MSKVMKEVVAVTGFYKNAQGVEKKRYQKIGSIIDTKNGPMLKLDNIPLREGGWDGWAYINDPKPRDDHGQPNGNVAPRHESLNEVLNDDMPF